GAARVAGDAAGSDRARLDRGLARRAGAQAAGPGQRDRLRRDSVRHVVLGGYEAIAAPARRLARDRARTRRLDRRLGRLDRRARRSAAVVAALPVGGARRHGSERPRRGAGAAVLESAGTLSAEPAALVPESRRRPA